MKNTGLLWFFLLVMQGTPAFTQEAEKEKENPLFGFGFVPQYATVYGMRLDMDIRVMKDKPHWLILSPQFYYNANNNGNQEYLNMTGGGFDLHYRLYLNAGSLPKGPYFTPGLCFQFYNVEEYEYVSVPYLENGVHYFYMEEQEVKRHFFKTGPSILLGYQFVLNRVMYIDLYGGIGFRLSMVNNGDGNSTNYEYDDWWGDLGYSGMLLNGGVRVGVIF